MKALPLSRHIAFCWLGLLCLCSLINGHAASGTWTLNATGGAWNDGANWQSGIIADDSASTANFSTLDLTADIALTLGADRTIRNLTFGDTNPSNHSWAISGNTLTLGGASSTITVGNLGTGTATINSAIAGSVGFIKNGAGTLVLGGVNTFTGNLTLNGGRVIAGDNALTGAIGMTFTTGTFVASSAFATTGNLNVTTGSTGTFDTNGFNVTTGHLNASQAGTFNKAGAGILTLGGTYGSGGSFPSAINVQEGTLRAGGDHRFRTAVYTISSGATLDFGGFTYNADNRGLYGAGIVTASSSTRDIRFSYGDFSGNIQQGRLLKENAAALTLSGTNDFAGTTTVSAGTLIVTGSLVNSASYSIAAGAKLQIGNATTTGSITNGAVTNAGTVQFVRSNALTFSNLISGAGTVLQSGAGSTTLNSANSYTGVTQITGGTLIASVLNNGGGTNNSSIGRGTTAATSLILNGGTLQYTGGVVSTDRLFSVGTNGGTLDASGSGAVSFTNAGSMGFNAQTGTRTLTLTGTNSGDNILAAVIGDDTGATSLIKNGAGKWMLSGVSTYTGGTTVNLGTLALSGANRLASTGAVLVAGGTLDLGAAAQSVGAVTLSSGTISNGTLTGTSYSATNSGAVSAVLAGGGAFTKTGNGSVTLSSANTYTGDTLVSVGTLIVSGGGSIANSATTVNSGATLNVKGTAGVTTVNAGGTLSGAGTLGATSIAGLHTPGNSPGIQNFGSTLDYTNGSSVTWELIGNTDAGRGTNFDGINVGTDLTITGTSTINLVFNVGSSVIWADTFWSTDREWLFYDVAGTTVGAFTLGTISTDSLGNALGVDRGSFAITYQGSDVYLTYSAIPEPSTTLLLAGALTALVVFRRRRRV